MDRSTYHTSVMDIDPKLTFWTGAWINMLLALACGFAGVRQIRRGEVAAHRRRMLGACALVVLFLVSYVFKVALLGPEALETWSQRFVVVLRVHEACIFSMLVSGSIAVYLAHKLGLRDVQFDADGRVVNAHRTLHIHRRAGWAALISGVLGLFTSAYVLYGMAARLGQV